MSVSVRESSSWYTPENIYCLLRLYHAQKSSGMLIPYKDIDKWARQFQKEIGVTKSKTATFREKMNHVDNSILYGSNEDAFLIHEFRREFAEGEEIALDALYDLSRYLSRELNKMLFEIEFYYNFEQMIAALDIMELEDAIQVDEEEFGLFQKALGSDSAGKTKEEHVLH